MRFEAACPQLDMAQEILCRPVIVICAGLHWQGAKASQMCLNPLNTLLNDMCYTAAGAAQDTAEGTGTGELDRDGKVGKQFTSEGAVGMACT